MLFKIIYWKWTNGKYSPANCFELSVSQQYKCAALLMLYWSYWLHKNSLSSNPSNPKYLLLLAFTKIVAIALLVICNKWFLINHAMITLHLPRRLFSFAERKQFSHLTMWHLWLVRYMPPYIGIPLAIMFWGHHLIYGRVISFKMPQTRVLYK